MVSFVLAVTFWSGPVRSSAFGLGTVRFVLAVQVFCGWVWYGPVWFAMFLL